MINIQVKENNCHVKVKGQTLDLLAEASLAFGKVLYGILREAPEDLKNELVKGVFECTLHSMKEEGENQ